MAVSELEEADLLRRLEAEKARLRDLDAQIKLLSASRLAARKTIAKTRKAKKTQKKRLHRLGIEPGSLPWQGSILPLDQRCAEQRSSRRSMRRESPRRILFEAGAEIQKI